MPRKKLLLGLLVLTAFLAILSIPFLAFADGDTIPVTFPTWLLPLLCGACGGAAAWGAMRSHVSTLAKDMEKNTKITEEVRASVHNNAIMNESALGIIKEVRAYLDVFGERLRRQEDRCDDLHPRMRP